MVYRQCAHLLETNPQVLKYLKNPFDYLPKKIKLTEVSARDGLQSQKKILSVSQKVNYINHLTDCGFKSIEIGSFVSPKMIPQMDKTDEVSNLIRKKENVNYISLIPNETGLKNFLKSGSTEGAILLSSCEIFSMKNINKTISESVKIAENVSTTLQEKNIPFRGYISCAFNSPFGYVNPDNVKYLVNVLKDLDCSQIILADTTGKATPTEVGETLEGVKKYVSSENLGVHLHDSCGMGIENILMAMSHGVSQIDSSLLGIGGCPNSPNARGNVNTLTLVNILENFGIEHNIDTDVLLTAQEHLSSILFNEK